MKEFQQLENQIQLLKASLEGELSSDEQRRLEHWLAASEENRSLYEELKDNRLLHGKLEFYEQTDMNDDWKQIERRISVRKRRLGVRLLSYAAGFAGLLVMLGVVGYLMQETEPVQVARAVFEDSVRYDSRQAYIEFETGEKMVLGENEGGFVKRIGAGVIKESAEGLKMEKADSGVQAADGVDYNRVVVPRGGEYRLKLADGTQVWLNSDSRLEFPVVFTGEERRVKLEGEAYFKVAPDKCMPFRVEVEGMEVEVLGTSFNIQNYNDCMRTTLVEGAVALSVGGGVYHLSPGEEAGVSEGRVKVEKVDVYERIAWTEGKFVFREMRLEEVMEILQRWYDIEVVYRDMKVKDLHFTGNVQRHVKIKEVLKFLEGTRLVSFDVSGRTVIVEGKR